MIIHRRGPEGLPREVELTPEEAVVKDIHDNLMDRGMDQGWALVVLEGSDLPTHDPDQRSSLQKVLADKEFRLYLIS